MQSSTPAASSHAEDKYYHFHIKSCHVVKAKQGRKHYKCDVCTGIYKHAFSLKRHYLRTHINYKYISESDIANCNISLKKLSRHVAIADKESVLEVGNGTFPLPGTYRCHLCRSIFNLAADLKGHIEASHPESQAEQAQAEQVQSEKAQSWSCQVCNLAFTDKPSLVKHAEVHSTTFTCKYCSKSFSTKTIKRHHERTHEGLKPYNCSFCSMAFSQNPELRQHVQEVHPSNFHPCDHCIAYFSRESLLSKHIQIKHSTVTPSPSFKFIPNYPSESDAKQVQCPSCPKAFSSSVNLDRHFRRAHGLRKGQKSSTSTATSSSAFYQTEEEFYENLSQHIAENLLYYVEGRYSDIEKDSEETPDNKSSKSLYSYSCEDLSYLEKFDSCELLDLSVKSKAHKVEENCPKVTYICSVCAAQFTALKDIEDHKVNNHVNVLCTHVEIEGGDVPPGLFPYLYQPPPPPPAEPVPSQPTPICSKCKAHFNTLPDLHAHILECASNSTESSSVPNNTEASSPSGSPQKFFKSYSHARLNNLKKKFFKKLRMPSRKAKFGFTCTICRNKFSKFMDYDNHIRTCSRRVKRSRNKARTPGATAAVKPIPTSSIENHPEKDLPTKEIHISDIDAEIIKTAEKIKFEVETKALNAKLYEDAENELILPNACLVDKKKLNLEERTVVKESTADTLDEQQSSSSIVPSSLQPKDKNVTAKLVVSPQQDILQRQLGSSSVAGDGTIEEEEIKIVVDKSAQLDNENSLLPTESLTEMPTESGAKQGVESNSLELDVSQNPPAHLMKADNLLSVEKDKKDAMEIVSPSSPTQTLQSAPESKEVEAVSKSKVDQDNSVETQNKRDKNNSPIKIAQTSLSSQCQTKAKNLEGTKASSDQNVAQSDDTEMDKVDSTEATSSPSNLPATFQAKGKTKKTKMEDSSEQLGVLPSSSSVASPIKEKSSTLAKKNEKMKSNPSLKNIPASQSKSINRKVITDKIEVSSELDLPERDQNEKASSQAKVASASQARGGNKYKRLKTDASGTDASTTPLEEVVTIPTKRLKNSNAKSKKVDKNSSESLAKNEKPTKEATPNECKTKEALSEKDSFQNGPKDNPVQKRKPGRPPKIKNIPPPFLEEEPPKKEAKNFKRKHSPPDKEETEASPKKLEKLTEPKPKRSAISNIPNVKKASTSPKGVTKSSKPEGSVVVGEEKVDKVGARKEKTKGQISFKTNANFGNGGGTSDNNGPLEENNYDKECEYCMKKFSYLANYLKHMKIGCPLQLKYLNLSEGEPSKSNKKFNSSSSSSSSQETASSNTKKNGATFKNTSKSSKNTCNDEEEENDSSESSETNTEKAHKNSDTSEKDSFPKSCIICTKTFSYRANYIKHTNNGCYPPEGHLTEHTIKKEDDADEEASSSTSVKDDEDEIQVKEENEYKVIYPNACAVCHKTFSYKANYLKHTKNGCPFKEFKVNNGDSVIQDDSRKTTASKERILSLILELSKNPRPNVSLKSEEGSLKDEPRSENDAVAKATSSQKENLKETDNKKESKASPKVENSEPKEIYNCSSCPKKFSYLANYHKHIQKPCKAGATAEEKKRPLTSNGIPTTLSYQKKIRDSMYGLIREKSKQNELIRFASNGNEENSSNFSAFYCNICYKIFLSYIPLLRHRVIHAMDNNSQAVKSEKEETASSETAAIEEVPEQEVKKPSTSPKSKTSPSSKKTPTNNITLRKSSIKTRFRGRKS